MASVTINPNGTSIEWAFQSLSTDQDSTTVQNNSGNTVYWWSSNESTKYPLNNRSHAPFDQVSNTLTYYFAASQTGNVQISLTVTGSDDERSV
jgi:hypothetical protein